MDVLDGVDVPSPTGFALVRAYRLFRHEMDVALRGIGLTTPQWAHCRVSSGPAEFPAPRWLECTARHRKQRTRCL